jgi:hypothetical protein
LHLVYYLLKKCQIGEYKVSTTFAKARGCNMKKVASVVLILIMATFLISPLSGEARGGHGGGHWRGGGHGGWWVPFAIWGGAAVLSSIFYSSYTEASPVVIPEQPQANVSPAPPVTPSSTEKIFVYPRLGQSEELQAKDRYECHSWAVSQTHYNPTQPISGLPEAQLNKMYADYRRAEDACLDGRGYTVK